MAETVVWPCVSMVEVQGCLPTGLNGSSHHCTDPSLCLGHLTDMMLMWKKPAGLLMSMAFFMDLYCSLAGH